MDERFPLDEVVEKVTTQLRDATSDQPIDEPGIIVGEAELHLAIEFQRDGNGQIAVMAKNVADGASRDEGNTLRVRFMTMLVPPSSEPKRPRKRTQRERQTSKRLVNDSALQWFGAVWKVNVSVC